MQLDWLLTFCLAGGAFLPAMLGLGGGVFYTPIQLALGREIHQAIPLSLLLIVITSLSASSVFQKAKRIDWKFSIVFALQMMFASFFAGLMAHHLRSEVLTVIFAVALALCGLLMAVRPPQIAPAAREGSWLRVFGELEYRVSVWKMAILALLAGTLSGLVGIGGGVLIVPAMVLVLGVPLKIAIGCSSFMVGLSALAGLVGHLFTASMPFSQTLATAIAVFIAAQLGARASLRTKTEHLRGLLGFALIGISLLFLLAL